MTITEYAALCREECPHPAQGYDDGTPCGADRERDGERVFSFCGRHWGPVLDMSEAPDA